MAEKSKILIIGGTGYIGKFIVEASAKSGHPTFALVREAAISDHAKGKIVQALKNSGVTVLTGDLYDHESLVKAMKQVDSAVDQFQLADQDKIIAANIKNSVTMWIGDGNESGDPLRKRASRTPLCPRTSSLVQPGVAAPPRDKVTILGDGNAKAMFNSEREVGTYTMKAVDDPRTLNKVLYIRPPKNTYSFNELVALWEKKIGKTLEKEFVPEEQLLKQIQGDFLMIIMWEVKNT